MILWLEVILQKVSLLERYDKVVIGGPLSF